MSQTRENELAHRIGEMTKNLNEVIRQAAQHGLKVEVNVLDLSTPAGQHPVIEVDTWRKL